MSIAELKGFGKEKDESYPHHTVDYIVDFTPKTKIEIVCNDDQSLKIMETIQKAAHTGRKGDGKIIITNVEKTLSIRNNDVTDQAV
jgi:nitrogen regulatory protein PII